MTANTITEYEIISLRNQLVLAAEALSDLIRDVHYSDATPEEAAALVNAEMAKINRLAP